MRALIFGFVFMIGFCTLQAQQEYVWDEYGIGFTLADDFEEVTNDEEEFSAEGDGMSMSIIPFNNEDIDENDIVSFTLSIFNSLNVTRVDDVRPIQLNGFKGGYAEGASDEARVFIMGLIDPESPTNFFVIITFYDDDENAADEAINICKSFQKL